VYFNITVTIDEIVSYRYSQLIRYDMMALPSLDSILNVMYLGSFVVFFAYGQRIQNSIMLLNVHRNLAGLERFRDTARYRLRDTIVQLGRRLLIVRAKGPGGNVGRPGLVVETLIKESGPTERVIIIDAARKLEGEPSGEVAEGTGVAIGSSGTERYRIEEAAARSNIALNAVVVEMSSKEALTPHLREAPDAAYNRLRTIIQAETAPGDTVIVAGFGKTIGIE
jgi:hypothetical protein